MTPTWDEQTTTQVEDPGVDDVTGAHSQPWQGRRREQ